VPFSKQICTPRQAPTPEQRRVSPAVQRVVASSLHDAIHAPSMMTEKRAGSKLGDRVMMLDTTASLLTAPAQKG
jgi:hypothetical protein